jgi:DNA-binding MarR family transcriptional regulator
MSNNNIIDAFSLFRRELSQIAAAKFKGMKLGRSQMIILDHLSMRPASMGELSDYVQSDPAATTRAVASLKNAGYLRSTCDKLDRRRTLIELTAKGRKKAIFATELRNEIKAKVEKSLTEQEKKQLVELLQKASRALRDQKIE